LSHRDAAERFSVAVSTAGNWHRLWRATGSARPGKQGQPGGSNVPFEGTDTTELQAHSGQPIEIPEGFFVAAAGFARGGGDLVLTAGNGDTVVLQGYFDTEVRPDLVSSSGATFPADLVVKLAGPQAPGQYAQAAPMAGAQPVGTVEEIDGVVMVTRADGTKIELNLGDPIFQGDILETGADAALGVVFADETTFAMAENGRVVLDEMIYDPGTQDGSMVMSVVQGVHLRQRPGRQDRARRDGAEDQRRNHRNPRHPDRHRTAQRRETARRADGRAG